MRLRNISGSQDKLKEYTNFICSPQEMKGKWNEYFKNNNPIHLEIGSGKGRFITTLAKEHSDVNYISLEKYSTVTLKLLNKVPESMKNLAVLNTDAKILTEIFSTGEINRIYLNFSDPWPKDRHYKRRLTYKAFLDTYRILLSDKGELQFKTDNLKLFEFSVEQLKENNWNIEAISYDLHNSEMSNDNVMTEYEIRFSELGQKINKVIASI